MPCAGKSENAKNKAKQKNWACLATLQTAPKRRYDAVGANRGTVGWNNSAASDDCLCREARAASGRDAGLRPGVENPTEKRG